jgi:hypothetical protein
MLADRFTHARPRHLARLRWPGGAADGEIGLAARDWIGPFRDSFPGVRMEIITGGQKVAVHFGC